MKLTPLKSKALKAAGYDPESRKMRVQTHAGTVYEYDDVPIERYTAFTGAASHGSFWTKKIQPRHTGKKVATE